MNKQVFLQSISRFSPFKKAITWYVVYFSIVTYFTLVLNLKLVTHFYSLALDSKASSFLFLLTPPLVLASALAIVFILFSFKWWFKIIFCFLIITGAQVAYFAYKYGIIFDYEMMVNLLETNSFEAKSYISLSSIVVFLIFGLIPCLILCKLKIAYSKTFLSAIFSRLAIVVGSAATICLIAIPYYQNYASIARNNNILRKEISPYNYVWYGMYAIKDKYFSKPKEFVTIGKNSQIDNPQERTEIFVVVIGETARAQNFSVNGYKRNTTPYTRDLKNMVNFAPAKSCGTATAVSVPCMFSNLGKEGFDKEIADNQSTLVDILKYSGYKVMWYDNDGGCKGVCKRQEHEIIDPKDNLGPKCNQDSCYDSILLDKLAKRVDIAVKNNEHTVIFLHLIGSHGPTYYQRVPKDHKIFSPSCEKADIENCSVDEIVNAYDNTIAYTDYILKGAIDILDKHSKDFATGLFYISDHGESLGEYGLFLHGTPYSIAPDTQTRVPMQSWFSDSFIQDHNINMECLEKNAKTGEFSHDNFFHSMLGILDVNSKSYNENFDIFKGCRVWIKRGDSSSLDYYQKLKDSLKNHKLVQNQTVKQKIS